MIFIWKSKLASWYVCMYVSPTHPTFHLNLPRYHTQCLDWIIPTTSWGNWGMGKGLAENKLPISVARILSDTNNAGRAGALCFNAQPSHPTENSSHHPFPLLTHFYPHPVLETGQGISIFYSIKKKCFSWKSWKEYISWLFWIFFSLVVPGKAVFPNPDSWNKRDKYKGV